MKEYETFVGRDMSLFFSALWIECILQNTIEFNRYFWFYWPGVATRYRQHPTDIGKVFTLP